MNNKYATILIIISVLCVISCKKDIDPPVFEITTAEVSEITGESATCGGKVSFDGDLSTTKRGVCWSTNMNPTLDNCLGKTEDGFGTGSFTSKITALEKETTYYVCAYATNEKGTSYGEQQTFTTLKVSIEIELVSVEGGTFMMGAQNTDPSGANYDEEAFDNESPVHQVTLSDFYIGKYEVTQAQWREVMGDNSSEFSGCDDCPVETVSWNDIQDFLQKLNALTGRNYALPTEAQWEFAARGGNKSNGYQYSGSNTLENVGWYYENSGSKTHPVGQKLPNELGIYDMSGNVREWCQDWYGSYGGDSQTNPTGPSSGSYRVLRGGSWLNYARSCRVSYRNYDAPDYRLSYDGFRVVLLP